ncbi:MAG: response regulator transcription factor [Bacteroidia bacterium]|nr:response regulator transcription factor [Bacteroidia bacterium]
MQVLIIEDEPKTAQSLKQGLEEYHYEVDLAYDGHFGLRLAKEKKYDIIVTDIILPYLNGIEICKELRGLGIQTPIIILTALGNTDDVVMGFDAGADDYLTKPFELKELLVRIRALLKRSSNAPLPPNILRTKEIEVNLDTRLVLRNGKRIELTPKEFALLVFFIRHRGKVVSKSDIADKVWDIDFDTGTNVIEVYVNYLRKKIDKDFEKKLIHTQFGLGYVFKDDEQ